MNYEHIKTGLLIGLVGLSMILTWQLWTFQPNIELLDDTARYVPNEAMSEERKLTEIIRPEQIVIHQQGRHTMIPTNDERFDQLYQKLLKTNFVEGDMLAVGPFPKQVQNGGIELIFPTSIPVDIFLSLFQVDQEEFNLPLSTINRLYMYVDAQDEQVHMQMLSSKDTQVVEVETNFSVGDFERNFLRPFNEYVEVFQANNRSSTRELSEHIYIPLGPVTAERLSFTASPIPGTFFRQALFSDPDSVKHYRQSGSVESFTDGNRMINIRNNGLFMEYRNPIFSGTHERSSKHVVQSSYEFINGHGGWTDKYILSDWNSNDLRDEAEYRLQVNDLPVLSFQGQDHMVLQTSRSGNQTETYFRPLFDLDNQPIDAREEVKLPSGEDVLNRLKQLEFFHIERLQKVAVGYEMIMPNPSFVTVEPHWFFLYDNSWRKVTFDSNEGGGSNGLE
ncbi:YycH family regulatory protein [Halalkalibacter nanhaiisediminis]|uniref:Regulatory protein YycH of two-component signal transduction system YycFG n=1 Tax=Halalkalibacter nanhaiisediminis TaxID=688079 RepID=A0A562QU42_9BACI|nr:two-component system activity regulator YycH [Halalkalibacter nanhaiisediminis]TWI59636.1 regulatory protein YycH of two-component signal transduction system YycFG [Halalkalibacter nanhaiisediminis]